MKATNVQVEMTDGTKFVMEFRSYASAKKWCYDTTNRIKILTKNGRDSKFKYVWIMD